MTEASTDRHKMASSVLNETLANLGAAAGSLHRVNSENTMLELVCSVGLPNSLQPTIQCIPKGKGLAGQAWTRGTVVKSCSLSTDPNVGLSARTLPFRSTFAIPVYDVEILVGVVGLAFTHDYDLAPVTQESMNERFMTVLKST